MKRGMSQVIQAILFIALSIAIIGIIFLWQSNFFGIVQKETSINQACSTTEFRTNILCYGTSTTLNIETGEKEQSTNFKFDAINDASPEIIGFLLSLTDDFGNSKIISTLPYNEISSQQGKLFTTDFVPSIDGINKISIIPQVNYKGKIISCYTKEKIVSLREIKSC